MSQLFTSGGQSTGVSALTSVLLMNIQKLKTVQVYYLTVSRESGVGGGLAESSAEVLSGRRLPWEGTVSKVIRSLVALLSSHLCDLEPRRLSSWFHGLRQPGCWFCLARRESQPRGRPVCVPRLFTPLSPAHPPSFAVHQLRISCFGALITAGKPPPLCHALLGRSGSQVLPTGIVMAPGRVSCPQLHAGIRGYKNLAFWFLWGKKKYL